MPDTGPGQLAVDRRSPAAGCRQLLPSPTSVLPTSDPRRRPSSQGLHPRLRPDPRRSHADPPVLDLVVASSPHLSLSLVGPPLVPCPRAPGEHGRMMPDLASHRPAWAATSSRAARPNSRPTELQSSPPQPRPPTWASAHKVSALQPRYITPRASLSYPAPRFGPL